MASGGFHSAQRKRHFISLFPPPVLPSPVRGVSALSPSIDLPPFMSCLMKRGSKKEICPSETRLDQRDVFTPNEPARPRFSVRQAARQSDGRVAARAAGRRRPGEGAEVGEGEEDGSFEVSAVATPSQSLSPAQTGGGKSAFRHRRRRSTRERSQ